MATLKQSVITAAAFGAGFAIVIAAGSWLWSIHTDRELRRALLQEMQAAAKAESVVVRPRTWPDFRSDELGTAVARLQTVCVPSNLEPDHGPFHLRFQLTVKPASAAIMGPIHEDDASEKALRELANRSPRDSDAAGRYGVGSPMAAGEELALRQGQERSYEQVIAAGRFPDTVFLITFSDSAGFLRARFPVLRSALSYDSHDARVRAADSTSILCTTDSHWDTWGLRRMRRPSIK
jgi:hypothetical protein